MNNFRTENINIKGNEYYNNDFKLYLDECMCLYNTSNKCDENCIKKTFKLTDLDGIEKTLFICQSYLRYKIQEYKLKMRNDYYFNKWDAKDIISKIIINSLNLEKYEYSSCSKLFNTNNDLINRLFAIQVCKRPATYIYLNINEYIEKAYKNREIANSLVEQLRCYFNENNFQKYKSKYKKVIACLNRINSNSYLINDYHLESDIIDVFTIIYDMKINEKINKIKNQKNK